MSKPHVARILIYGAAVMILTATLWPSEQVGVGGALNCLLCGERGLADAFLNVCLFLPLGAAIALTGGSPFRSVLAAFLLSAAVEAAQLSLIPGRDASLGDLLFNSLGALAGVTLVRTAEHWLLPGLRNAARLSLAAALAAAIVVALTGLLLVPAPPASTYFVMWSPKLAHLAPYNGIVQGASLGDLPLLPARIQDSRVLQHRILDRAALRVSTITGTLPVKLAALVAIYDEQHREVLLLGFDQADLVFRIRTRAADLRLDRPDLRVRGALREVDPGTRITVVARQGRAGFCLGWATSLACNLGFTAGDGWTLLMYGEHWSGWLIVAIQVAWLAALAFPIGFWTRRRWESLLAVAVFGAALLAFPTVVGLRPTPMLQWGGSVLGLAAGAWTAAQLMSHRRVR